MNTRSRAVAAAAKSRISPVVEEKPKLEPPARKRTNTTVNKSSAGNTNLIKTATSSITKTTARKTEKKASLAIPQTMDELSNQKSDEVWQTILRVGQEVAKEKEVFSKIDIPILLGQLDKSVLKSKQNEEKLRNHEALKRKAGTTRSGKKRGTVSEKSCHFEGKYVNKGIDDSQERFQPDEQEYLDRQIENMKKVNDLKFEHLRYLITQVYLDELKEIKSGKLESKVHNDYVKCQGKSKQDMLSEIRMNLFTSEQNAYIYGLLQGVFETTEKDSNGDIKHSEIQYNNVVMLTEISIRIVKHVLKLSTNEEAFDFMVRSWDEAYGFQDDD